MAITSQSPSTFDPDELALLRRAFDDVWLALQSKIDPAIAEPARTFIAKSIMEAAVNGERDPERLWCHGMSRARGLINYWNSQPLGF
jgi:hypothetical protein